MMNFFDFIRIAWGNLVKQKVRTGLTVAAIVVGTMLIVVMISIAFGIQQVLIDELESAGSLNQIMISGSTKDTFGPGNGDETEEVSETEQTTDSHRGIKEDEIEKIKQIPHVRAVTPIVHVEGSFQVAGGEKWYRGRVRGQEINPAGVVSVETGRNLEVGEKEKIILGSEYIETFDLSADELLGKKVTLRVARNWNEPDWKEIDQEMRQMSFSSESEATQYRKMKEQEARDKPSDTRDYVLEVVGVAKNAFEGTQSYIPISLGIEINDFQSNVDKGMDRESQVKEWGYDMAVALADDTNNVEQIAEDVKELGLGAGTFQEILDEILNIFKIVEAVLGAFGGIALFVAALGIVNTMVMAIYERTREIGVMKAVGANSKTIKRLFSIEAASLGFWGGVIGVVIGVALMYLINWIINTYFLADGGVAGDPVLSGGPKELFVLKWWLLLAAIGFSTLIGLMAGFYPARRAAKLDPVDALRYE